MKRRRSQARKRRGRIRTVTPAMIDGFDDDDLDDDDLDGEPKEVGMPADVLCATVFEPPNYAVPGYIVEGLTLLAGKPKIGKSWMMLHVGIAVACGSFTLDDIHCVKGDVLYAALEDNKRRLQRRLRKLLNGRPAPERLRILSAGEMPRLSEGGTALIRAWIEQAPEPKLVVIDVLAKVRDPRRRDQGLYDSDYAAMEELKRIADEYGIAIVVIHHLQEDGRRRSARPGQRHDRFVRLGRHRAGAESDQLRHHHSARSRPRHRRHREGGPVRPGDLHVDGARGG